MRDRLIELISQEQYMGGLEGKLADHLIANGVIVMPCKVGDAMYVVSRYYGGVWRIYECYVESFTVYNANMFMSLKSTDGWYNFGVNGCGIGKAVFLTREGAEKALEKMKGGE
jgi:hypothetical protein